MMRVMLLAMVTVHGVTRLGHRAREKFKMRMAVFLSARVKVKVVARSNLKLIVIFMAVIIVFLCEKSSC